MGWTNKETLQDLDIDIVTKMQRQLEEENKYLKKFSNCCSRCVCQCVSNSLDPPATTGSAQASRPIISPPKALLSPPATAPSHPIRDEPNPSTDKITDRRVPRLCQQTQQITPGRAPVVKRGARIAPTRNCMITGGVELVPLLAKRRSQPRPISLGTTDVTKIDKYSSNGVAARHSGDEYLHELCTQMNQKQRRMETTRVVEFETSKQHFDTWSSFWGRPGHGAPLPNKNKLNLDNLLYSSPR
ncbi:AAEL002305-PA [Aedes aegypti]|uniref:AAEL002305-PA n=1 Tax=Aedes aegypti TaxID=7159 RepID=Q17IL1_AEDAE|nr:AAEL002305-PA [Aedes aegypti]